MAGNLLSQCIEINKTVFIDTGHGLYDFADGVYETGPVRCGGFLLLPKVPELTLRLFRRFTRKNSYNETASLKQTLVCRTVVVRDAVNETASLKQTCRQNCSRDAVNETAETDSCMQNCSRDAVREQRA